MGAQASQDFGSHRRRAPPALGPMGLGIWAWDAFGVPWGWAQRLGLKAPGAYGAIKQRALGGSSWGMGALRAPLGRMGPSVPLGDQGGLNELDRLYKKV